MSRLRCANCGIPTIEDIHDDTKPDETLCNMCYEKQENTDEECLLTNQNTWVRNPQFKGEQTPPPLEEELGGGICAEDWENTDEY